MAQTIGSLDLNAFSDLYSDSNQYFWFESDATATYGAGAHVTLVPDTTFISNPTGQNILMNTDGFSIRNGLLPMMTLDNNSLDFNVVDTTAGTYVPTATFGSTGATIGQTSGAHIQISSSGLDVNTNSSTNIASFGTSGARIGKNAAAHSVIDADGQRFYASNGSTLLANIGYASGTSASGTATAPYYDFGIRKSGTTKGNYSIAEGHNTTASGYASHVEGSNTIASNSSAHAEGSGTTASGLYSHAEGGATRATGDYSHAEGAGSRAIGKYSHAEGVSTKATGTHSHVEGLGSRSEGNYSHAQNYGTVAARKSQTVIGENNIADTGGTNETTRGDYAFIVGNGNGVPDDPMERSNALTVDWDGRIGCGDYSGNFKSIFDIFYPKGSYYETSLPSAIPSGSSTPNATDLENLGSTWFDPNYAWGGTWELETAGQVHVSSGSGYAVSGAETNTSDGGEATHRLADVEMAHGHGFTQPKIPNHAHTLTYAGDTSAALSGTNPSTLGSVVRRTTSSSTTGSWSTNSTGGGGACTGGAVSNLSGADSTRTAHNNMQPYIVVNRWHRTA